MIRPDLHDKYAQVIEAVGDRLINPPVSIYGFARFNEWFYAGPQQVAYITSGLWLGPEGQRERCINLSNIAIREADRRNGVFKYILYSLEGMALLHNARVQVENVGNAFLREYLVRRGYVRDPHSHVIWPNLWQPKVEHGLEATLQTARAERT